MTSEAEERARLEARVAELEAWLLDLDQRHKTLSDGVVRLEDELTDAGVIKEARR